MKTLTRCLAFGLTLLAASLPAHAQSAFGAPDPNPAMVNTKPLKQSIEFRPDRVGDCRVTIAMTLNASEWQVWTNGAFYKWPSLWKRELIRKLPGAQIKPEDVKISNDPDQRKVLVQFTARGIARPRPNNRYELNLTDLRGRIEEPGERRDFLFVQTITDGSLNIQQEMRVFTPDEASNIRVDKGDNDIGYSISYALPAPAPDNSWLLGGAGFAALALGLTALRFTVLRPRPAPASAGLRISNDAGDQRGARVG
ncbi:MAG: hypothetical protein JNM80_07175 [Phycisphaerae bacterium]|nr:hypothetical protein [Phycisphaerae bacterium]